MQNTRIGVVKAARHAPFVAAALNGGNVQVWNLNTFQRESEFNTVYDGLDRLALSHDGENLLAAAWKGGVAGYETATGTNLWHRGDVAHVQRMRFSEQGNWVWCDIEGQPAHCLSAQTGETLVTWPTVLQAFDGPFSPRLFLVGIQHYGIGVMENHIFLPRPNNAFRDVAFTPSSVNLSEFEFIRCLDIETGEERWRYVPPDMGHVGRLSFQADGHVYGMRLSNTLDGERVNTLMRFSLDGTNSDIRVLGPHIAYDGFGDGVFVDPGGDVYGLETGDILSHLPFC